MLISGVQHSDSAVCVCIYIYIYIPFQIFSLIGYYNVLKVVPRAVQ